MTNEKVWTVNETKVITFGNMKGGTGKTTNATMFAYELAEMGYKTLLIDHDPQADATQLLLKTHKAMYDKELAFDKTLMSAMKDGSLKEIVTQIKDNLYLLPSFRDFKLFTLYMETKYSLDQRNERMKYLDQLLNEVKSEFDFIIIDTPPTSSLFTDGALYASDYVVIASKTEERSLKGAKNFVQELRELFEVGGFDIDILGILPVIFEKGDKMNDLILSDTKETFGEENVMDSIIHKMKRLERWNLTGITNNPHDHWDKHTHKIYTDMTQELLQRLQTKEGIK